MVALIQPMPLFGQHASFADALASDNARECELVTLMLSKLDASLCAIESHRTACEFLQIVAKTRRASLRNYKSVIEKMLLWCLMIRHKSLLDVDNSDLIEFFLFLELPADNWVAKPTRRFIYSRQDVVVNKLWRPFRYVKNNTKWCRPLVSHFLVSMKSRLQEGLVIPKKVHLQEKIMPPNMATLESEAVEYLKKISSYTSLRGRHEKKLFVFVCAYYLRVSLPEFAKLAPYIYMDDLSLLANGQWAVSVNSPERCIIENFPSEFTVYLNRYRSHLGLASGSVSNEHVALFSYKGWGDQPDSNTIYDWGVTLPRIHSLGIASTPEQKQHAPKQLRQHVAACRCRCILDRLKLGHLSMSIEAKLLHLQAIQNVLAPYRYLYCVDLEATCDDVGINESPRSLVVVPDQMETIEIGLVVIDLETLEVVDEFQRFVRPQINPVLTDFCKQLTSIQQTDVDGAGTYVEVGQELGVVIARYPNAAWVSWGDYDARQLERDAGFAACPSLLEGLPHFNARKWHAGLYDNRPKSLKQTVESLGLVWQGTYHRGIDDARNVASIVKEMLG